MRAYQMVWVMDERIWAWRLKTGTLRNGAYAADAARKNGKRPVDQRQSSTAISKSN
jgi:hypothetical protein